MSNPTAWGESQDTIRNLIGERDALKAQLASHRGIALHVASILRAGGYDDHDLANCIKALEGVSYE